MKEYVWDLNKYSHFIITLLYAVFVKLSFMVIIPSIMYILGTSEGGPTLVQCLMFIGVGLVMFNVDASPTLKARQAPFETIT